MILQLMQEAEAEAETLDEDVSEARGSSEFHCLRRRRRCKNSGRSACLALPPKALSPSGLGDVPGTV